MSISYLCSFQILSIFIMIPVSFPYNYYLTFFDFYFYIRPTNKISQHVWRMARSSNNTRVSVVVQPQVRAHNSMLKGSDVMVMGGPSRGMIGMYI